MAEVEERLGITPIEKLLAERQQLVEVCANLRAKYGAFGTWDNIRKNELSTIKMALRARYLSDGTKVTEGMLEDAAHADARDMELVTIATNERAK